MPLNPQFAVRKGLPVAAAFAVVLSLGVSPTASAEAPRVAPVPASSAGKLQSPKLRQGEAFMGWRERASLARLASVSPNAALRPLVSVPSKGGIAGIDVSGWQGTVDWRYWKVRGKSFAYVKATEGTSYRNRYFASQYRGSYGVGMFRGAYHFATPDRSSGHAQASYFVRHGGAWRPDGRTLPGVLDIEYNPYGQTCYGMSNGKMVAWIKSFTRRYKALTHRDAVIYSTADWWGRCAGNTSAFSRTNPLWVARYSRSVGGLPGHWPFYTFWQYSASPIDQDRFSSRRSRLVALARG